MKYKAPEVAAIFFMTSFNRDRRDLGLPPPPRIRTCHNVLKNLVTNTVLHLYLTIDAIDYSAPQITYNFLDK